jgi:transcription initiation factor IIE alpha subunit
MGNLIIINNNVTEGVLLLKVLTLCQNLADDDENTSSGRLFQCSQHLGRGVQGVGT